MGTIPASENVFPILRLQEGATPSTPPSTEAHLYVKGDGLLYWKDDAGTEYPVSQAADLAAHLADTADAHDASAISFDPTGLTSVTGTEVQTAIEELDAAVASGGIPPTIFDAQGDLIVASAADTAARLALGASGTILRSNGTTAAWAVPAGAELDYAQVTSATNITATTEATANTIVTGAAVSYDGSTAVVIEFYSPSVRPDSAAAGRDIRICIYDGSSSIGQFGYAQGPTATNDAKSMLVRARITPSNASHTYSIRAFVSAGTGVVSAGAGGNGAIYPAYVRITKV